MKIKIINKNKKGFALLFSVLISSLLLSIGLSIFRITLKELAISTASRQSIHAFYAADSGRECALYWDTKVGRIPTFGNTDFSIECGQYSGTLSKTTVGTEIQSKIGDSGSGQGIKLLANEQLNYYVEITKTQANAGADIKTTVTSFGHDTEADDRVQRAITQTY